MRAGRRCLRLLRAWVVSIGLVSLVGASAARAESTDPPNAIVGQSAEVLYPRAGVGRVEISPNGRWIVAEARQGRLGGILAQRVGHTRIATVIASDDRLKGLRWVGPDTMIASFSTVVGERVLVARFDVVLEEMSFQKQWIDAPGGLVDALPLDDDRLLWEFDRDRKNSVHRVTLDQLVAYGEERTNRGRVILPGETLATIDRTSHRWLVDRSGRVRVAWRRDEEGYTILWRGPTEEDFRSVYSFSDEAEERWAKPMYLSSDESKVLVSAYNGRDTLGLHEFDPEAQEFGATLFQRFDVDVMGVLIDDIAHEVIAATFEADGEPSFHYFDSYRDRFKDGLGPEFPLDSVQIMGGTRDRRLFVFFVSDAANPGDYYFRDAIKKENTRIASHGSEIDRARLSPVESFVVNSRDGTEIEAFLTLPLAASGPSPLVVMPHGGPAGVRDRRRYDPFVQYLASWGFAVLQPNYRGSAGYGRTFRETGKKEWARGIEDDIDAAVDHAIALPGIDSDRICIIGGSYGGFSALASVVRHENRYRCAISINGVSDIPLLAETSDYSDSRRALEQYKELIGDLDNERDKLLDASPVYSANKISVPVFIIYGTDDRRVDPDHAHRMLLMMELYGLEHDSLEIKGMAHSPRRLEWIIINRAVRRQLTRYLMPEAEFVRDPAHAGDESNEILPQLDLDL